MNKLLIALFLFFLNIIQSQELKCSVIVNYDKITNVNTQIFKNLEQSLNDFVNKTVWTDKVFKNEERISCSMFITINAFNSNQFDASIQVQSSRPIFNSNYESPILNINDKDFTFSYVEFENLIFNPNSYDSNLISVISFYSYIILGVDAESFSLDSGNSYFQSAQNIASLAMPSSNKGWLQTEKKQNRFYLISDLLSPTFKAYRNAIYEYHFKGLDTMSNDSKSAKEVIKTSIASMLEMNSSRPNAYLTRIFFDSKADELVAIFSDGPSIPISDLVANLTKLSPTNSSKWNTIKP